MKPLVLFSGSGRHFNPKQGLNVWKRQGPLQAWAGAVPWDKNGSSHNLSK